MKLKNSFPLIYVCGGQLIPEVLFKLKGLGLCPNTQSEDKNISEDDQLRKI